MRFPLTIAASVICAYALAFALTVPLNPEVRFWAEVVERRDREIAAVRAESPRTPIIFFTGGSSTAFSIDPAIIEEELGMPAFNLGLPVAAGARYILHQAMRHTKPGDILVVCLEPDLLTNPNQESSPSKIGFALEAINGNIHEAAGGDTFQRNTSLPDRLNLSRPGAPYLCTLAGRVLTGHGYRYKLDDIGYRGIIRTKIHDTSMQAASKSTTIVLHPEGRELLELFAISAHHYGVRLAYSMPWRFTETHALTHNRDNNGKILADIANIMPAIDDGFTGAIDGIEHFSDSPLHLSEHGTLTRSNALASALHTWISAN